jgi:hypothetical protein
MRVIWPELAKEAVRMEHYTRTGLILRSDRESSVFFYYLSYVDYIGPTVELFVPYWDRLMILYSSMNSGGRSPKRIVIEDGGSLKGSGFFRYWSETGFKDKIYAEIFKPDVEERLLESTYELSDELYGVIDIGFVTEANESRGRDIIESSLDLQSFPHLLFVV